MTGLHGKQSFRSAAFGIPGATMAGLHGKQSFRSAASRPIRPLYLCAFGTLPLLIKTSQRPHSVYVGAGIFSDP